MPPDEMSVGELAGRTGLTIRTLRYYDEIGLLSPPRRSAAGYRRYGPDDVVRLQQIKSLRQLGLSLREVGECLERSGGSTLAMVEQQLARAREQRVLLDELCRRLERIAVALRAAEAVSVEAFVDVIEVMDRMEQYYTPEQLAALEERRRVIGEERIKQVETEAWPRLIAAVRAEMDKGTDPSSPAVRDLARQWMGLVGEFTGGDPGITKSLNTMWQQEESIQGVETAPMREMMAYISRALAADGSSE